jgi:hypothetical protein
MAGIGRRGAVLALAGIGILGPAVARARMPGFLSAAADANGTWRAAAFDANGAPRFELALPARGHGAAVLPDGGMAVMFARRPGDYALVLDPATGAVAQKIVRAAERWFCGHGAFSADGSLLYATEIDAGGEGLVGVYAVGRRFARIGEFSTCGADPHDIRLAPGGRALWVANGGIRTDPRLPRARLQFDDFSSSLVLLDAGSGTLLQRHALPEGDESLLSLRHFAIDAAGQVYVAMQHEGPRYEKPALVAVCGDGFAALDAEATLWESLDHYTGSAAVSADGELIAVTSPRGGAGAVIEARSRKVLGRFALPDGCGVAAHGSGFLVTSGLGGALAVGADCASAALRGDWLRSLRWDNHLVPL